MTTVQRWTGRETRALRQALRLSIRDFSAHLGVAERTVSKWEAALDAACPRPEMQAALDTALGAAGEDVRSRFASTCRNDAGRVVAAKATSDLAAAARRRMTDARNAAGLSPDAFARLLGTVLGWSPTAERVVGWETTETPPGDVLLALDVLLGPTADNLAGLIAVYPSRSQLTAHLPADRLLDGARRVRAIGLSLNMLCQDYADRHWQTLLAGGTHARCLFLDPAGTAIQAREAEEGFVSGQLAALTKLNVETLLRVRERLPGELQTRMELATYDETLRFNIVLVDDQCVAQPYLTDSRGVDSPAFVIRQSTDQAGLYQVFEQFFESRWQRGEAL
ncbi:helix-turn-helix domain-containing protein [Micromonospora sp. C32]|uniref:DUF5919 domain-containing protein n=1 Tax=Micromonospora sp. C32 TaxID=2824877 RepID=UPI001B39C919|nr:DUF5919 domain-containing protein [Micromonospora sp. C32]MBQ1058196.1 helix-turn-helix domain-containing protein [Micromonospora sp. C32]